MVQIQHQRYVFARFEVTQVDRITNMSLQSQEGGNIQTEVEERNDKDNDGNQVRH